MGSPTADDLDRALLAHFAQGMDAALGDAEFDALALAVFAYQYDALPAYHAYCQRRGALPQRLRNWSEIPAVPAQAFKDLRLWCDDDGVTPPAAVFRTPGTTTAAGATARPLSRRARIARRARRAAQGLAPRAHRRGERPAHGARRGRARGACHGVARRARGLVRDRVRHDGAGLAVLRAGRAFSRGPAVV